MCIYRFKIKTHPSRGDPESSKYITMFYDEDAEEVVKAMAKYDKEHSFTYINQYGELNTIADMVITKETYAGDIINLWSYRDIFDYNGKRIKGVTL